MEIFAGSILCILGGLGVGTFLLPLKVSRTWQWENSWTIGILLMWLVFPIVILFLISDDPLVVYREAGWRPVIILFVCGLIQGTAAFLFTYGTTILGLALGYALMIGCTLIFGLLVPLFGAHLDRVFKIDGLTLLGGLAILLIGIGFSGRAGLQRERELASLEKTDLTQRKKVNLAVIIALIIWVGFANCFYYFIHEWGAKVEEIARAYKVSKAFAPQFNNLPFMIGMLVMNLFLGVPKMVKQGTLRNYWSGSGLVREYLLCLGIALPWFVGQGVFYAMGKTQLGPLGVSIGAALFMGTMIVISNVVGVGMGEWKGVSAKTTRTLYWGLIFLVIAMVVIAIGNALQAQISAPESL